MSDYKKISNHYKKCLKEHGDSHQGHDWPNYKDMLKRYKIMSELFRDRKNISVLDLGCGTGMFLDFMKSEKLIGENEITYEGADISEDHINIASNKFAENKFYKIDVMTEPLPKEFFETFIKNIWPQVNHGIAFNVMSSHVDYERGDLFHLPHDALAGFITKNLSRNYIIRNDYGLYEYTTHVFKDINDD